LDDRSADVRPQADQDCTDDLAASPVSSAATFNFDDAPIPGLKKTRNSGFEVERKTPKADSSENSRRSEASTVSPTADPDPELKENEKPGSNVIPTGSQLQRTPFIKDGPAPKPLGSSSFQDLTPPDQRKLPTLIRRSPLTSLDGSGSLHVSGSSGVSKSGNEKPPVKNIDDIVVAAAALTAKTPEKKAHNVIPSGKQLARTPFHKGSNRESDLSEDPGSTPAADFSAPSVGSPFRGPDQSAAASPNLSSMTQVPDPNPVTQVPGEASEFELRGSSASASPEVTKSRSARSKAKGKRNPGEALKTCMTEGQEAKAAPSKLTTDHPSAAPSKSRQEVRVLEDVKGATEKKRFVLSKKTPVAAIEVTEDSNVGKDKRGRKGANKTGKPAEDLPDEVLPVPPAPSSRQPVRRSVRGPASTSADGVNVSAAKDSSDSSSVKSVAKEKVLPARSGRGKSDPISEGLNETVLETIAAMVRFIGPCPIKRFFSFN